MATSAVNGTSGVTPVKAPKTKKTQQQPKTDPYPNDSVEISSKPDKKEAAKNIGNSLLALASIIIPVIGDKCPKLKFLLPILGVASQLDGPISSIIENLGVFVSQKDNAEAKTEEQTQAAA